MLTWTDEKPTKPGWYWYEDEDYGPVPVYVEWTGFVDVPAARQLSVTMACGDDFDQPLDEVANLTGQWAGPLNMPKD